MEGFLKTLIVGINSPGLRETKNYRISASAIRPYQNNSYIEKKKTYAFAFIVIRVVTMTAGMKLSFFLFLFP